VGLRYVHVEPRERGEGWVELRLDENHRPPVYLATVRIFADRRTAPDMEHVREVAPRLLEGLGCRSVEDYLVKGQVLERAREAIAGRPDRPDSFDSGDLRFERGSELVTVALEPRERSVYRVTWRGAPALSFWFAERGEPALYWTSPEFRRGPRVQPRAVEHGFSYVPWALGELETVRADLVRRPRELSLGLPLETTTPIDDAATN